MTEKLLTGTLSLNTNKQIINAHFARFPFYGVKLIVDTIPNNFRKVILASETPFVENLNDSVFAEMKHFERNLYVWFIILISELYLGQIIVATILER